MARIDFGEPNHLTNKEINTFHKRATDESVKCSCGHSVVVTNKYNRVICSWCGRWVYKNKQTEFRYNFEKARRKNGK